MDTVDTFTAFAPDGSTMSIEVQPVPDDSTWFEMSIAGQVLGRIHWRADTDAYMATRFDGEVCGSFPALTDAEDTLVRENGYYVTIPTSIVDTDIEKPMPRLPRSGKLDRL